MLSEFGCLHVLNSSESKITGQPEVRLVPPPTCYVSRFEQESDNPTRHSRSCILLDRHSELFNVENKGDVKHVSARCGEES